MTHMNDDRNETNQGENGPIETHGPTCGSCTEIGKSEGQGGDRTTTGEATAAHCGRSPGWGPYRSAVCRRPQGHPGPHAANVPGRRGVVDRIEWAPVTRPAGGVS